MKYAVLKCVNGNFAIASEHGTDKSAARLAFFQLCAALENAKDVITAEVMLIDEQLNCVDNLVEFFSHPVEE